jgi:hypothetical protein
VAVQPAIEPKLVRLGAGLIRAALRTVAVQACLKPFGVERARE